MLNFEKTFKPVEKANKDIVLSNTWGHLYSNDFKPHKGYLIYTLSAYGNFEVIDSNFEGVEDNPWLFEDLNDYISCNTKIPGSIYIFQGTYRKLKNQRCVLKGKTTRLTTKKILNLINNA